LKIEKKPQTRPRRSERVGLLLHVSPYRLKIGAHIKPRYSDFALQNKVWMIASLASARQLAKELVEQLNRKCIGYGGLGWAQAVSRTLPEPGQVKGAWIYRVKPTGPVERETSSSVTVRGGGPNWTSSFPVRITAIFDTYGEPGKNVLPPPGPRNMESPAFSVFWEAMSGPDGVHYVYERYAPYIENGMLALKANAVARKTLRYEVAACLGGSLRLADEALDLLNGAPKDKRRDMLSGWLRRKRQESWAAMRARISREHHKLGPDLRYKRSKSWKKEAGL
jgi:hypothetical protein